MSQAILQKVGNLSKNNKIPELRSGYTIKISQKVKEGDKQRVQSFEGIIIKMNSGYGADSTVTVRKTVDGIGVEKIFPLCLPTIDKIQVIKKGTIRRSKLYYMRKLTGKAARLKETWLKETVAEAVTKAQQEEKQSAQSSELSTQKEEEVLEANTDMSGNETVVEDNVEKKEE